MGAASTLFHLLGALRRAIGRVLIFFILFFIIGAAIIEIIGYAVTNPHGFAIPTHIAAAVTGIVLGYASALTVLVGEAIRFLIDAIRDVEKGVQAEVGGGVKILDRIIAAVEGKASGK